jgi:hypothetical protein
MQSNTSVDLQFTFVDSLTPIGGFTLALPEQEWWHPREFSRVLRCGTAEAAHSNLAAKRLHLAGEKCRTREKKITGAGSEKRYCEPP